MTIWVYNLHQKICIRCDDRCWPCNISAWVWLMLGCGNEYQQSEGSRSNNSDSWLNEGRTSSEPEDCTVPPPDTTLLLFPPRPAGVSSEHPPISHLHTCWPFSQWLGPDTHASPLVAALLNNGSVLFLCPCNAMTVRARMYLISA